MSERPRSLGIHESIRAIFDPWRVASEFESVGVETSIVSTPGLDDRGMDVLVTLAYEDAMLSEDLLWIHSVQSGVDRFPVDRLAERGIVLTNSTGIHGESVAETTIGYILSFARGLHRFALDGTENEWDRPVCEQLGKVAGERLCVVGLGTLGRAIAEAADALGMDVTGVKRTPEDVPHVERVYATTNLTEALSDTRYVALAVPLTPETERLVDADAMDAIGPEGYLINVARGEIVDEEALVEALRTGAIAGAALDVFREEPLPVDSPLRDLENVILTPHTAGLYREYPIDVSDIVRRNLARWDDDRDLINRVV